MSGNGRSIGVWRSLVAHLLWEQGVGGSNPLTPTISSGAMAREVSMKIRLLATAALVLIVSSASAQQPPPPVPAGWPDLSGTWRGTWGGAPTTLVIFKRSEAAFVSQALSGFSNFAQTVVGHNDGEVRGTLSTDGRAGPLSLSVSGRMGIFNGRLALVLNGQPGWSWNDSQELVFTTVTPQQMTGSGTTTQQWGPNGAIDLTREFK
jgi:hypothetical protein